MLTVSCEKKQNPSLEQDANENMIELVFDASYPETKTTIDDNGVVAWEKGDKVTLYYYDGATKSVTATAQSSGTSVKFTASIPTTTTPEGFFAVYPAGKGGFDEEGNFILNASYTSDGSFKDANLIVAYSPAADLSFNFQHVVGIFKVALPEGGVIKHGETEIPLKSLNIKGKEVSVVGKGKFAVTLGPNNTLIYSQDLTNKAEQTYAKISEQNIADGYVYVPTLPGTFSDGFAIRFNATTNDAIPAVCTKSNSYTVDAGHIQPVSNVAENIVWDYYFSPDGTGDGKSETSPAPYNTLETFITQTAKYYGQWRLYGATLHLQEGTYTPSKTLVLGGSEEKFEYKIIGNNAIMDGVDLGKQFMSANTTSNLYIEGVTLKNFIVPSGNGSVMNFTGAGKLIFKDCVFQNNETKKGNSGALYLGSSKNGHEIIDCTFENNTATSYGGALCIGGSAVGTTVCKGCTFKGNKVTSSDSGMGGAVYVANADLCTIENCVFDANSAYKNGGALYGSKAGGKIFVARSLFIDNTVSVSGYAANGGAITVTNPALGVYACTFNYNHSSSAGSSTSALVAAKYIVANSTFVESAKMSYGVITNKATAAHQSTVVNSIIINTSTTATHPSLSTNNSAANNYVDCGYNLYTRTTDDATTTSITGDATSVNGVTKNTLGITSVDRSINAYVWNGTTPAGFTKCNLSNVEALIKANTVIGEEFWSWLATNGYNNTDIRGHALTDPIWPGSYQN